MSTIRTRLGKENRGAIVVEFAIVIFLFLLLLFGTIEFGWALFTKAVVTNAAREGARLAVTPSASTDTIEQRVQSYLEKFLLTNPAIIGVDPLVSPGPPTTPPSGEPVTVTVDYQYTPLAGSLIRSTNWRIVAAATMRRE